MRKSDKQGLSWLFPDEAEIHDMSWDQIIPRSIEIRYSMVALIRGNILRLTLTQIEQCFEKISTWLVLISIPRIVYINLFLPSIVMLHLLEGYTTSPKGFLMFSGGIAMQQWAEMG